MDDTKKPKRWRWIALVVAVLLLGSIALALPALLSTAPLRPVLEGLLRQRFGVPVAVEDADLSWFSRSTFTGVTVGSPTGFGEEAMLTVEEAVVGTCLLSLLSGRAPPSLTLTGADLTVLRAPGGRTNLGEALGADGHESLRRALSDPGRVVVKASRLAVSDRQTGLSSYLTDAAAEWSVHYDGSRTIALSAAVEGPAGAGAISFSLEDDGEAAERSSHSNLAARNLHLAGFAPVLASLFDEGALAGHLELDLDVVLGPGRHVDLAGNGVVRGFEFAAAPWTRGRPISDSVMSIAGSCSVDLDLASAAFHSFRLGSSVLDVDLNGSLAPVEGVIAGDLAGRVGINLGRASFKFQPLVSEILPVRNVGGDVEVSFAPTRDGFFRVTASGENLESALTDTRSLPLGESALESDVRLGRDPVTVTFRNLSASTRFFNVAGGGSVVLGEAGALHGLSCDTTISGETRYIRDFLLSLRVIPPLLVAGEVDVRVQADVTPDRTDLIVDWQSEDFDLRYQDVIDGMEDNYFFRGKPMTARLTAGWPRPLADLATTLRADLRVRAPLAAIQRNDLPDFVLDASYDQGVLRFDHWQSGWYDAGRLSAAGQVRVGGIETPEFELTVSGSNLEPKFFAAALAGASTAVFAAPGGYWDVKSTMRMDGSLELAGSGRGITDWLRSLRGGGRLVLSKGEVVGSPFLERISPPFGEPGPRQVDEITATLTFEGETLLAVPVVIRLPHATVSLAGRGHWTGRIEFIVPPRGLFEPGFVARYGSTWPADLFRVTGTIDRPVLRIPDPDAWVEAAAEGLLDEAVQNLLRSEP